MEFNNWRSYKIEKISEIFELIFHFRCRYEARLNTSVEEFRSREIKKSIRTFFPAIYQFAYSLILILMLVVIIFWPKLQNFIELETLQRSYHVDRLDLLYKFLLFPMIFYEFYWLFIVVSVMKYRDTFYPFCVYFIDNNHERLPKSIRGQIVKNFIHRSFIFGTIYRLIFYGNLIHPFVKQTFLLLSNQTSLISFFSNVVYILVSSEYVKSTLGFILIMLFCFVFIIKFLNVKLDYFLRKEVQEELMWANNQYISRTIREEYHRIFAEINQLNQTVRIYLFLLDFFAKYGLVFTVIFHRFQRETNAFIISALVLNVLVIGSENYIFFNVTLLPEKNKRFYELLNSWNAKRQLRKTIKWRRIRSRCSEISMKRFEIRSNLFVQSVIDCPLSIDCGPYEFNKKTHIEIIATAIVFILLFYKKILLNIDSYKNY
ncbi:hypothetical protein SSS_05040 [Sarcoptes scabiei]|uniref:Gustatory receptor n=1 Tax=Sarcoptes scabiei TaxID=52283 RepID=A0A834R8S0_SARSC|nr:hypothetical protein SSS_05040 [Sarcoptes scabiei]